MEFAHSRLLRPRSPSLLLVSFPESLTFNLVQKLVTSAGFMQPTRMRTAVLVLLAVLSLGFWIGC